MSLDLQLNCDRRLNDLDRYDVLDTSSEEAFDRITRLVCRLFRVKMSTVTFIDGHRQWFKSRQGVEISESTRDIALCRVPVAEGKPLIVENAAKHPLFENNPFVCGPAGLRFYAGVPIFSARGAAIGTLCAMDTEPRPFSEDELDLLLDLAKMVETELELRVQASTDALTQVLTRRAFFHEGERAIALAKRHRYDVSCIVFDIDHFKSVNDQKGHATGDLVLKQVTRTCHELLRKSDVFGRLGGEEFAVILPHTGPADGLGVAEKLRLAIASSPVKQAGEVTCVSASFGVAALDPSDLGVDELLEHADRAMYLAKNGGRNCSIIWQGESTPRMGLSRRVLKAGKIVFNRGNSAIDCTVKRLSDMGARLDVVTASDIPRQFKLSIATDAFSRACTVVDHSDRQVEVVFA